jgi:hypothetical protein
LCRNNHDWKNVLGQSFFHFHVSADCPAESVDACFVHDLPVSKIVRDHMDHCLVDVHEGSSWDTCCGFYIVAVRINRFILVCFVDLCAEVLVADE